MLIKVEMEDVVVNCVDVTAVTSGYRRVGLARFSICGGGGDYTEGVVETVIVTSDGEVTTAVPCKPR